jgi:hypothetical protein
MGCLIGKFLKLEVGQKRSVSVGIYFYSEIKKVHPGISGSHCHNTELSHTTGHRFPHY